MKRPGPATRKLLLPLVLLSAGLFASEPGAAQDTSDSTKTVTAPSASVDAGSEEATLPLRDRPLLYVSGLASDDLLNMRSLPERDARILTQLAPGTWALPDLERQPAEPGSGGIDWIKIWVCGEQGWVALRYLAEQPADFPRVQDCPGGLRDPLAELASVAVPIDLGTIALIPDDSAVQSERLQVDETSVLHRSLGQSEWSTNFVACVRLAEQLGSSGNSSEVQNRLDRERLTERVNSALARCVDAELLRWQEDMDIAYRLYVGAVAPSRLRQARDEQRSWVIALNEACTGNAVNKAAAPLTDQHPATCALERTLSRTIELEAAIKARPTGSDGEDSGDSDSGFAVDNLTPEE